MIVSFLNDTLFTAQESTPFWDAQLPAMLAARFPRCLSKTAPRGAPLRQAVDPRLVVAQVATMMGFRITSDSRRDLLVGGGAFSLVARDIKWYRARIKSIYVVEMARADRQLRQSDIAAPPLSRLRALSYARQAIIRLKTKLPYCPILTEKMAYTYAQAGCIHRDLGQLQAAKRRLFKASIHFETAVNHALYRKSGYQEVFTRYIHTLNTLIQVLDQLGENAHIPKLQNIISQHPSVPADPNTLAEVFSASHLPTPTMVRQWINQLSQPNCSE